MSKQLILGQSSKLNAAIKFEPLYLRDPQVSVPNYQEYRYSVRQVLTSVVFKDRNSIEAIGVQIPTFVDKVYGETQVGVISFARPQICGGSKVTGTLNVQFNNAFDLIV